MTTNRITVAKLDQLPPGARKLCSVDERRIALFNVDGTICAIDNHCTHRDGPVGAGPLADNVVTCPWHGWRFNVVTGRCLEPDGKDLRQYPVSIDGNEIRIEIAPTSRPEKGDGIYCGIVRYGVLGHVSRVGSNQLIRCSRGDQVIVHTDRGLEVAEVLEAPNSVAANSNPKKPAGELLRVMNDEDHRQQQSNSSAHHAILRLCQQRIAERNLPLIIVDAEQLFDGQTIIVYFLGEPAEALGPIAVELSNAAGNRHVKFTRHAVS